ncbi:hypothetical protein ACFLZI_02885 [Nitrospirota bacterium]
MELLNAIYDFIRLLLTTTIPVSLFSFTVFVTILCTSVVFARFKYGLLFALLSIFIWGFFANYKYFLGLFYYNVVGLFAYGVAGLLLLTLIIVSFVSDQRNY